MSIGPLVHWTIGPFVHWSIGPLDYRSMSPLVECQMFNVNKVELLSERTFGVPPVIFEHQATALDLIFLIVNKWVKHLFR